MTLAADVGGVVVPTAIMGFNAVVIVVALVVRRRGARARDDGADAPPAAVPPDLEAWQRHHEHALDVWMRDRERLVVAARGGDRPVEEPDPLLLREADAAVSACPDAELRGSLTAMRAAGEAAAIAFTLGRSGDGEEAYNAFQRHREVSAARLEDLRVS